MAQKKFLLLLLFLTILSYKVLAQCNTLRPQIDIKFNTDQDCAPVQVTEFEITYFFNAPQDPATIAILYEWHDPLNGTTLVDMSNGLVPGATTSGPNTSFTANATFTYVDNDGECSIIPTASIFINGVICPTSSQQQTAFFWGTDEQANGVVAMDPANWEVCFGNPVTNAVFRDDSEFNCNINVEQDNPNQQARHVQFVYGTNHNAANAIKNLTLTDGGVQGLTNATGNLVSSTTRGIGMPVTGAYFGPIDAIPFPADGPSSVTFPMNAPASALNVVGNRLEITLFNWNVCNPWNGDALNPNYEDAVVTRGYIIIVDAPAPNFETRDAAGVVTSSFCINETIFLQNLTPNLGSYSYVWRFYDDAAGTNLLATRNSTNTQYAYATGGTKLIRLRASSPTAQSPCVEEFDLLVNITPALAADILVTDLANVPITPDFCQEASPPLTNFNVRFTDASVGTVTANTVWRWEFYDQNNALVFEAPVGGGYSNTSLGPFNRVFTTPGIYRVRLAIRDNITQCESTDEVRVRVFEKPQPAFGASRVCSGNATAFSDSSTVDPIMGEQIVSWEWDMNYDGTTFSKDPALDDERNFNHTFPGAGSYQVALRVTTNQGSCSQILEKTVVVDPTPLASITSDRSSGCSTLRINFTNNSIAGQPAQIREYRWEIDQGSGFQVDSIQRPSDPGFSASFTRDFENTTSANRIYTVRLRVITVGNCEQVSTPIVITVNPGPTSGFVSLNYSPFNTNCSPVSVDFAVDNQTQSLNPTDYQWTIADASGVLEQISTGTTPDLTYEFINDTQLIKDFLVTLRAVLPSGCFGDSTRIIRVSPIPSSGFTIDTVTYDCDKMILHLDASQKGLVVYDWTISINGTLVFNSTTVGDNFDYEVTRIISGDQTVEIKLVTTNVANCESNETAQVVTVPRGATLNASFTATPLTQTLPNSTVTITNTTTAGPWQYQWDFGDGTTSTDPGVNSHTYETFGSYTILLTVNDNDCVDTHALMVEIDPVPPVLEFDYAPASGCAPLTVNFTNRSKFADPASYFWEFGTNQGTSRAVNPTYTYFEPGLYSVTLSATNVLGDTVSLTKSQIIEVLESPVAQFSLYPQQLDIPGDILYTNNRSFGATSFQWDFGDGNASTDFEPQHKYVEEGMFTVELIASSVNGCTDTARSATPVRVISRGELLIPNAFTPNTGGPGSTNKLGNEVFIPLMNRVRNFQMMIFNRWGDLLFESSSQESGWDGYFQGKLCQQDVYIYKIVLEYDDGKQITRTGDINLIR
jgi:gliding motility-associated-like protein